MSTGPQLQEAGAKRVAGLAVRTDNATETRPGAGMIPGLWERFRTEDWFGQLEELGAFGPPLGVYSAYESDASGSFQLLAGREIQPSASVSAPLRVVSVPAGRYLVFPSHGQLPQSVVKGWQDVWAYFAEPRAVVRAYTCDFETYPSAESVELWIAVDKGRGLR